MPAAPDSTPGLPQHPKPALLSLTAVVLKVRMPRRRQAHAGAKRVQSLNPPAAWHAKKCAGIASCALVHADPWHRPVAQGIALLIGIIFCPAGIFSARRTPKPCGQLVSRETPARASRSAQQPGWSGAHVRSSTNPALNYVSRETFACAAHRSTYAVSSATSSSSPVRGSVPDFIATSSCARRA